MDIKRLKGDRDLARMNHASHQTEQSQALLDAAEAAYQAALNPDQALAPVAPKKPAGSGSGKGKSAPPKNFTPSVPAPEPAQQPEPTQQPAESGENVTSEENADQTEGSEETTENTESTENPDETAEKKSES